MKGEQKAVQPPGKLDEDRTERPVRGRCCGFFDLTGTVPGFLVEFVGELLGLSLAVPDGYTHRRFGFSGSGTLGRYPISLPC